MCGSGHACAGASVCVCVCGKTLGWYWESPSMVTLDTELICWGALLASWLRGAPFCLLNCNYGGAALPARFLLVLGIQTLALTTESSHQPL